MDVKKLSFMDSKKKLKLFFMDGKKKLLFTGGIIPGVKITGTLVQGSYIILCAAHMSIQI